MTEPTGKSGFTFHLPDYWTPDQALAVVEFIDDLREEIWAHYHEQLIDAYRQLHSSDIGGSSSDAPPSAITPLKTQEQTRGEPRTACACRGPRSKTPSCHTRP